MVIFANAFFIQFARSDFITIIEITLIKTGLVANSLDLELPESIAMGAVEKAKDTARHIQELGVRIAVDDFSTGYSFMACLRRLAFDNFKLYCPSTFCTCKAANAYASAGAFIFSAW